LGTVKLEDWDAKFKPPFILIYEESELPECLIARSAPTTVAVSSIASSAAIPATTRAPSASTTGIAAFGPRPSLVYGNRASAEITAVERRNRCARLRTVCHLDKAETAQSSTKLITNQIHFANRSILSKSLS
jgi:hypothetical protein